MTTEEEIKGWLGKQPQWLQEAANRLVTKGKLNSDDIGDLVELLKAGESDGGAPRTLPAMNSAAMQATDLRLNSIGPVAGIDALKPKEPLTFGGGNLTVVYGENGSGKSGYARIIARACGKTHGAELRPNVYTDSTSRQECTFGYSIGGDEKKTPWLATEDPLRDLKQVDIFDSEAGRLYIEKDSQFSYQPSELVLFTDLVEACRTVEKALSAEQGRLVSALPRLPDKHADTPAGKLYSSIERGAKLADVSAFATWSDADEASLQEQLARVRVADPAAAAAKKRGAKEQIDKIRASLKQAVTALSDSGLASARGLRGDALAKRKRVLEAAGLLSEAAQLEGVGTTTWKAMWRAASNFSTEHAYPSQKFPATQEGARCVLCQQDLEEEGRLRMARFEEFVRDALETEATEAEGDLKQHLDRLPSAPSSESVALASEGSGLPLGLDKLLAKEWSALEVQLEALRSGELPDETPVVSESALLLLTQLDEAADATEDAAKALDLDAHSTGRADALSSAAKLEARKWAAGQFHAIETELDRLTKWGEFDEWKRKTQTAGISRKAGSLSETLISEAYIKRFNEELTKLGARKIKVELVKTATRQGRVRHGIQLLGSTHGKFSASQVLSEGERRIVSLAAFIAEVNGRPNRGPVVFDDPISSLDQIFEEKIISRLIELSSDRQVLVFTHRLSFLGIMRDQAGSKLHDIHIRREPWGTGQPGEVPIFGKNPVGALKKLKGERLVKARKARDSEGEDAYHPLAKALCSDFRILIERIVETVFLADVIQRHRREISTKGKVRRLAVITESDCDLVDEMMTKYSRYEHSQPAEAPVPLPDPAEIDDDLARVIEWHNEFKARVS